jgi:hypothetical protein
LVFPFENSFAKMDDFQVEEQAFVVEEVNNVIKEVGFLS